MPSSAAKLRGASGNHRKSFTRWSRTTPRTRSRKRWKPPSCRLRRYLGRPPGARRETIDLYIKRLEALESIANSFTGVEKSFAIQAGREVRIIVKPEEIDEFAATRLASEIARKIEENLDYPGQIKVSVVRETRSVDYAR